MEGRVRPCLQIFRHASDSRDFATMPCQLRSISSIAKLTHSPSVAASVSVRTGDVIGLDFLSRSSFATWLIDAPLFDPELRAAPPYVNRNGLGA